MVQQDEIIKHMHKYASKFPVTAIPHVTENNDINDILHNYKRAKPKAVAKDIVIAGQKEVKRRATMAAKILTPTSQLGKDLEEKLSNDSDSSGGSIDK
jgi:hypothetical protein